MIGTYRPRRAFFPPTPLIPGSAPSEWKPPDEPIFYGNSSEARSMTIEEVDALKRVNCARYTNCLDHACGKRWRGFVCSACPIRDPLKPAQHYEDIEGLARLLVDIVGPGAVRLKRSIYWLGIETRYH